MSVTALEIAEARVARMKAQTAAVTKLGKTFGRNSVSSIGTHGVRVEVILTVAEAELLADLARPLARAV